MPFSGIIRIIPALYFPRRLFPDLLTGIPENVYVKLYGRYFNLCLPPDTGVS
jgi:hypothetical protein